MPLLPSDVFENIDSALDKYLPKTTAPGKAVDPDTMLVFTTTLLDSSHFISLTPDRQVQLIEWVFQSFISHQHAESENVGRQVALHYRRLLGQPDFSTVNACKLYDCLYGLYWCAARQLSDMSRFDEDVVPAFLHFLQAGTPSTPYPGPPPQRARHIAYFAHYAHLQRGNAVMPLILSAIREHQKRPDRKIHLYCVQWSEPGFIHELAASGMIVRDFTQGSGYSRLDDIALQLRADDMDVVITDIASSIATHVFSKRVAPLQTRIDLGYPYWSTPDVDWTFLPGKDWQPGFGIRQDRYSRIRLRQNVEMLSKPVADADLDAACKLLPRDRPLLAVFARLIKLTPEFLGTVRQVLLALPETRLLIVGTGDDRAVRRFAGDASLRERVTFMHENVDLNVYGRIIDVMLDTFPLVGGNAVREVAVHGKPIVAMRTPDWIPRLMDERDPQLLASTTGEYMDKVAKLVRDNDFYQQCGEKARFLALKASNVAEMVDDIETGIADAIKALSAQGSA